MSSFVLSPSTKAPSLGGCCAESAVDPCAAVAKSLPKSVIRFAFVIDLATSEVSEVSPTIIVSSLASAVNAVSSKGFRSAEYAIGVF